jgi:hypothetical protein
MESSHTHDIGLTVVGTVRDSARIKNKLMGFMVFFKPVITVITRHICTWERAKRILAVISKFTRMPAT